nr:hypothetical protein [Planococcus glaciei]
MTIKKRFISLFFIDSLILLSSIYACYLFLYPYASVLSNEMLFISTVTLFIAYHSFAWHFGLYRKVWSYASVDELKSIVVAVSLTIFVAMIMQYAYSSQLYIRTLMLSWMLLVFFIGASRISLRILQEGKIKKKAILTSRTMVVGAGQGGRMIARHMKQKSGMGKKSSDLCR